MMSFPSIMMTSRHHHSALTLKNSSSPSCPPPLRRSSKSPQSSLLSTIVFSCLLATIHSRSNPNFVAVSAFSVCFSSSSSSFPSSITRKGVATAVAFPTPRRHHPSSSLTLSNSRGRIAVKMATSENSNETDHQSSSSSTSSSARLIKILCLHGKYENGKSFLNRALLPLRRTLEERLDQKCLQGQQQKQLSIQWEELTAPFPIDPKSAPFSNEDVDRGFQWWTLPKGVRSFEATEVGVELCLALACDFVFELEFEFQL